MARRTIANTFPYSVAVDPASRFVLASATTTEQDDGVRRIDPQSGGVCARRAHSQFDVTVGPYEIVIAPR